MPSSPTPDPNNTPPAASDGADSPPIVHVLSDDPADKDDYGGHRRVADALVGMIREEPIGRSVAIEGGYGSGKSTVIRMTRASLDSPNYHVFEFDAWHHEGDPLRLTFLQSLRESLARKGWLASQEDFELKRRFAAMEKTETVVVTRSAPVIAMPQAIGYIAVAFGLALWGFRESFQHLLEMSGLTTPMSQFWLLAAITTSLFGSVLCFVLHGRTLHMPQATLSDGASSQAPGRWRSRITVKSFATALLLKQAESETKTTQHGTGETTSRAFERHFRDIVSKAITQERRLVIVIDNLDRLTPEEALSVWNTMRVFTASGNSGTSSLSHVWLIAPFDRASLARMWDDRGGSASPPAHKSEQSDSGAEVLPDSRSVALLDKVFHTRLDVPVVVLSTWRAAFEDLLKAALPDSEELARHTAGVVADAHMIRRNRPPTPRELKIIANDIGSLVRMHGRRFPLASLAAYVLMRREGMTVESIRLALLSPESLHWLPSLASQAAGIRQDLACLVFGVHDEHAARGLLLEQPFVSAVMNGDRD
ncbi:MAG TPA: P-loop NTPase fold protein, partial [Phycisphaerales bacterium]|nr:P-loop NTPase fold protein [Phycisphaerales bacterium]